MQLLFANPDADLHPNALHLEVSGVSEAERGGEEEGERGGAG